MTMIEFGLCYGYKVSSQVQVMVCAYQTPRHYLCQCGSICLVPYGDTRSQRNSSSIIYVTIHAIGWNVLVCVDIKNNAWVTVTNDFWVTSVAICQYFEWRIHEWKSLAKGFTSDPKIIIHSNECIILFLLCSFMSWTHNSAKNKSSIPHSAIVAKDGIFWLSIVTSPQLICDVTRMWGTGIMT